MRSAFYGTVLVCLLAGILGFATATAAAQTSNQLMQKTTSTIGPKAPSANPADVESSGEAKAGTNRPSQAKGPHGKTPAHVSKHVKGGEATVARVDRCGNCLQVYSHPSVHSNGIACLANKKRIHLTGMFSKNRRWAQLDNHGWVQFGNLKTDVKAPRIAAMDWHRSAAMGKRTSRTVQNGSEYWGTSWGPM